MTGLEICPFNQKDSGRLSMACLRILICISCMAATLAAASTKPSLDARSSLSFFTNAASHLLMSQFDLNATHIEIYPTNQYTPAVHRLLQVAVNVYEATSTNSYPTVFRPLFSRDANGLGSNLFISGFTNVDSVSGPGDIQLALPVEAVALATTNIPVLNMPVNVYGIPWIIGARKGLPNFNEFEMESAFQLIRKLQVARPSTTSPLMDYRFNQMFAITLTNQIGVECWNSYMKDFADPVTIYVTDTEIVTLTNDEGLGTHFAKVTSGLLQIPDGTNSVWPGYNPAINPLAARFSFQIPLDTSVAVVPPSLYRFNSGGLPYLTTNLNFPFETDVTINGNVYPQPHWYLTTSNDVRVIIMDTAINPHHIIDYIQLAGPNSSRDLSAEIIKQYDIGTGPGGNNLWSTNLVNGVSTGPIGIISQMGVSLGKYQAGAASGVWSAWTETAREIEVDAFRAFFGLNPIYNNPGEQQAIAQAEAATRMEAPYTPVATVVQHISWQANGPLVHYLASDLNWSGASRIDRRPDELTSEDLGRLNQRYMPWGGNPLMPNVDKNPFNRALKDPLLWRSDDWDFPTNASLSAVWLGRIHRGTPWQTIYLKSADILQGTQVIGNVTNDIGTNVWAQWTGDTQMTGNQYADAIAMAPVQDRHVASLLAYLMNAKPLPSLFSVNKPKPDAWAKVLRGLAALTNNLSGSQLISGVTPQFERVVIRPHSPQAQLIARAIESARRGQPDGLFHDVGDILEVPQLSDQSPFLNWNNVVQQERGISDEAYEILPGQLLPLLRADPVGRLAARNSRLIIEFTGYDHHAYAVEISSNLLNWKIVSTNCPVNGTITLTNSATAAPRFYRSVLIQ